jgi:hypothetical protein
MLIVPRRRVAAGDPNFANVSLLLHGDGANGSTTIIDSSPSPKTVTAVGNAQINTTVTDPFGRTGVGVMAFDGTGDSLRIANSAAFSFDADFTVEFWFYQLSNKVTSVFAMSSASENGFAFGPSATPQKLWFWNGTPRITQSSTFAYNTWHHAAVSRSGSTVRMYFNGNQEGNYTESKTFSSTTDPYIGNDQYNQSFNGYIDDLRITKGIARYTANFTPPTAPFPGA